MARDGNNKGPRGAAEHGASGHDDEHVLASQDGAADLFLVRAEGHQAKAFAQQPGQQVGHGAAVGSGGVSGHCGQVSLRVRGPAGGCSRP